eukprot:GILJ01005656.1.p1 GENE.GILJ01005656.1~~GILJ01005656.1.p1  ORF type:complete len:554 (-),score=66.86 GILJ01005656.1:261-1823(-)
MDFKPPSNKPKQSRTSSKAAPLQVQGEISATDFLQSKLLSRRGSGQTSSRLNSNHDTHAPQAHTMPITVVSHSTLRPAKQIRSHQKENVMHLQASSLHTDLPPSSVTTTGLKKATRTVKPAFSTSTTRAVPKPSSASRKQPPARANQVSSTAQLAAVRTYNLSEMEEQTYGDRFPPGFEKVDLLGRGGCALVWCGVSPSGEKVAIKQVSKISGKAKQDLDASKKELRIARLFFDESGGPRLDARVYPGLNHVCSLLSHYDGKKDMFLVFENGGTALTKHLFEIKGEFWKGQRIYQIKQMPFFHLLRSHTNVLRKFLRDMFQVLDVLSAHGIVHSDLKPDNILIEYKDSETVYSSLRVIDFGSAFNFDAAESFGMATPEYLPPEILEILIHNKHTDRTVVAQRLYDNCQPWSFDMWSLGAIFLELLNGFPLWMSYKGRVTHDGKNLFMTGLFAVNGRDNDKILQKQYAVISNLRSVLKSCPGLDLQDDDLAMDLLSKMMSWNPLDRISPKQALQHPFLIDT